MSTDKPISLRIPENTLERIDTNAERAGMTRTEYLLSWLPETYDADTNATTETATNGNGSNARV